MSNTDNGFAAMMGRAAMAEEGQPFCVPEEWMQGRTVYGGLAGALVLSAMRPHVPEGRKIRSLLISFVGPLNADPFYIQARELRSGKSVTTLEAGIIQNDAVCLRAVGSFGGDRDSKIRMTPADLPEMPGPSASLELPYVEGITPAFTRHFDYRWALGDLPFSGNGGEALGGWIRFKQDSDCLTEEWLICLADAWPTPVLSGLCAPAAASTMTWALGFVHLDRDACTENKWWGYHCGLDSAEQGYVHERSRLWDPQGRLALYSQQTTTVFA